MKILSIGNSFSHDAHRYLHQLAKANGEQFKCVNLYIGGCSLRTHYLNMLDNNLNYNFEFNGEDTGIKVSLGQALASDDWEIVTLQQASHFSTNLETYFPYIKEITAYVRKYCPHTKIFIHETWAYEDGSERLKNLGYERSDNMLNDIKKNYAVVAKEICADGIIPCGTAMYNATQRGLQMHRDTFHASLGMGRYLLALTWYKTLTGKEISDDKFSNFEIPVSDEERKIIICAVNSI